MAIDFVRRFVVIQWMAGAFCLPAAAQVPSLVMPLQAPSADHAEQLPGAPSIVATDAVRSYQLSLEEAKCRTLQNSVIMDLASAQLAAKCHALDAARKDYLPKLLNSFSYFHFDSDLGTVVTTPGIFNPATSVAVPVLQQDSTIYTAAAIQPITPLLKVRAAVEISEADVGAAEAQRQFARRELTKGVEQLYFGLLAAQRIQGGLQQAVAGARQMVDASNAPAARISLVEVQQNLVAVNGQVSNLREQLNQLVGLPQSTELVLQEPPAPQNPFGSADEVVGAAVAASPKIREARMQVAKAAGAVRLANADFVPSVNAYGFYVNQNATPTIQEDFTGVGVSASYVLEWGKKNDTLRQWKATEVLARQNLRKEIQDAQLNAIKAFNEAQRAEQALAYARQLAQLNREATLPTDPFQLKFAVKDRLESELGAIKADVDYRNSVVELRSIAGFCE
jgi:outer membrane protein TolC